MNYCTNRIQMKCNVAVDWMKKKLPNNKTTTYLKTYASIWSFRLKLMISQRTDFNNASHIDLKDRKQQHQQLTN